MSRDTSLVMCHLSLLAVYDLQPRKLTGTVKYVCKVDREYVDNRVYVGVRLDDPGEPQCTLHRRGSMSSPASPDVLMEQYTAVC